MKINNISYKFILHKNRKNDRDGYIYLQKIQNRKKTRKSLGLPKLSEKYWNNRIERVRVNKNVDYILYNTRIEEIIDDITKNPKYGFDNKNQKSFLKYFENYINSEQLSNKHGTRIKYKSVLTKLKKYNNEYDNEDLLFSDLNIDLLNSLKVYLLEDLEINTAIHYLKIIRTIIRKSIKSGAGIIDPFIEFSFPKRQKKEKHFLSDEEILIIKNKRIDDERLNKIRNIFLFQFFSSGMRISDILTLRISNLINGRLNYVMFKTKTHINIKITPLHIALLSDFIDFGIDFSTLTIDDKNTIIDKEIEHVESINSKKKPTNDLEFELLINEIETPPKKPKRKFNVGIPSIYKKETYIPYLYYLNDFLYFQGYQVKKYNLVLKRLNIKKLINELNILKEYKKNKGFFRVGKPSSPVIINLQNTYEKIQEELESSIQLIENTIEMIKEKYYNLSIDKLNEISDGSRKNDFVFGLLKNEEFKSITDFSKINKDQYLRINKTAIVYNRNLKELQKKLGIKTTLRSHLPRVSFTNLLWNIEGSDIQDIKDSLGHSSIQITASYLQTGFRKDSKDEIQEKFIDRYNKK